MQLEAKHFRRIFAGRAFTLVEMLTVLAIITVVLLIVIPLWNTIIGNSAVANAHNIIAATLATARADAVYSRQPRGILFFVDPQTSQSAMVEVQEDWTGYVPTAPASPNNPVGVPAQDNGTIIPLEIVNHQQSTSSTAGTVVTVITQFVYDRDVIPLPGGVGVVLNNNSFGYQYDHANSGNQAYDRYVHFGVIMFDANGTITTIPFGVSQDRPFSGSSAYTTPSPTATYVQKYITGSSTNQLGVRLGLYTDPNRTPTTNGDIVSRLPRVPNSTPPSAPASGLYPLMSSAGILVYDRSVYLSQRCGNDSASSGYGDDGAVFNELDFSYALPNVTSPLNNPPSTAAQPADKADEERWLDQNGTAFLVNQFNGELIKAQ